MHHFVSLRKDDALFVNGQRKHWKKLVLKIQGFLKMFTAYLCLEFLFFLKTCKYLVTVFINVPYYIAHLSDRINIA